MPSYGMWRRVDRQIYTGISEESTTSFFSLFFPEDAAHLYKQRREYWKSHIKRDLSKLAEPVWEDFRRKLLYINNKFTKP
jgi:hypothetical protein